MGNVGAVFLFEWKRSLTLPRMGWWAVLAGFPVFVIGLIRFSIYKANPDLKPPAELWIGFLFGLVPMLVSMLGTLLWATPIVSVELERRSWVYLAVRPHGITAVLVGKYLAAVTWVIPPALVGLSLAVLVSGVDDGWRIWWSMTKLACLSIPAYAAIYSLIGVLLPRRAMVLAVAYSLVFELLISFVPAIINTLTVHHRLQALLLEWCRPDLPPEFMSVAIKVIGDTPAWKHVAILALYPPILLAVAIAYLRRTEFASSAESDI